MFATGTGTVAGAIQSAGGRILGRTLGIGIGRHAHRGALTVRHARLALDAGSAQTATGRLAADAVHAAARRTSSSVHGRVTCQTQRLAGLAGARLEIAVVPRRAVGVAAAAGATGSCALALQVARARAGHARLAGADAIAARSSHEGRGRTARGSAGHIGSGHGTAARAAALAGAPADVGGIGLALVLRIAAGHHWAAATRRSSGELRGAGAARLLTGALAAQAIDAMAAGAGDRLGASGAVGGRRGHIRSGIHLPADAANTANTANTAEIATASAPTTAAATHARDTTSAASSRASSATTGASGSPAASAASGKVADVQALLVHGAGERQQQRSSHDDQQSTAHQYIVYVS